MMPGRFLDVLNRVTRSDSFKSQKSDASSTPSKGSKKVSFDTKVKDKQFKPRKKRKQRIDGKVASFLKPSAEKKSGDTVASGEFWFNVPQPSKHDSGTASLAEDKPNLLSDSSPGKASRIPPVSPRKMQSSSAYNYDLDPGLHTSQQPSQVPRVKRNLVRNIVAQFNEEAQKRNTQRYTSTENLDDGRAMSPGLIEATPDNAPNQNQPFSYTSGSRDNLDTLPLGSRSKSDYNIQQPSDLIYAQVVVNGNNHPSKGDGRYKTTIHTKVPNRAATAKVPAAGGSTIIDSKKLFSKSTGNLHRDDSEDGRILSYQRKNKKTDNSYYKFDQVDDELQRSAATQNGKSSKAKVAVHTNGHQKWKEKQLFRSSSLGVDSENNDPMFEPSHHQLIQLTDAGGLLKKSGGAGGYETRNVEKWSENEVGPNSRKFTEREFIHEVSLSDDHLRHSPKTNGRAQTRAFQERKEEKSQENFYRSDQTGDAAYQKKSRYHHGDRVDNVSEREVAKGQRNVFKKSTDESLSREKQLASSTAKWHSSKSAASVENTAPLPKASRTLQDSSLKSTGLSQYYFGERSPASSSPLETRRQEQIFEAEEHNASWQNNNQSNGFLSTSGYRRNSSDSGSGVGLLSSKLVKQANAEVNGYFEGNGIGSDEAFELVDRQRCTDSNDFRLRTNEKFASTSWLNRRDSDPVIEDPFRRYDGGSFEVSTPYDKMEGRTTEERRLFRKEETKRTTKRETRTSRPLPSVDYDDDAEDIARRNTERLRIGQRHQERPDSRSSAEREHHHQKRAAQKKTENSNWNESALSKSVNEQQQLKSSERKVNIGIKEKTAAHQRHHAGGAFGDDYEDKMETSESEPQLYSGSQDSHMSLGSRISSAEEEEGINEDERANIIAAHVNTPQSLVKQMNKQQISYENSQHRQHESRDTSTTGRRFWFERSTDEVDDVRRSHTRLDKPDANSNHYLQQQNNNNHLWTSATMSRLETNKNRRNNKNDVHRMANTMGHRDTRRRQGDDIRIQLNDQDVPREALSNGQPVNRNSSFNSRVGSYHSENESQHSGGSSSSQKKRVNFKAKGSGKRGVYGSNADLSPMHREALLRSASPARAPSTTGSMKSNDSEASHGSNKSVIIHKTVEADILPARQYQVRSANTSPAPPPSVISAGGGRESRTVQRSFSLLSPWKPRKYKDKYEKREVQRSGELENGRRRSYHEEQQRHLAKQQHKSHSQEGETVSHNSSSERLDSLSPLPSEGPPTKNKNKKKTGIFRRHSMPKDSRFANLFRRKKDSAKS